MNRKTMNQHGFTLVELLAAISLLGIVIIGFIPFFTNYATFTGITEDKLNAINTADKVSAIIKDNQKTIAQFLTENDRYQTTCDGVPPADGPENIVPLDSLISEEDLDRIHSGYGGDLTVTVKSLCQDEAISDLYPVEVGIAIDQTQTNIFTYINSSGSEQDE